MVNKNCKCPYIICKIHGNCMACIEKSRKECEIVNCMEEIAENLGAIFPLKLPKTVNCDNYESMSQLCAKQIAEVVNEKPDAFICIPAEDTAIRIYEILKEMQDLNMVNFQQVRFIALYEWLDIKNEVQSGMSFLKQYFYAPLKIQKEQMISFETHRNDFQEMCKKTDEVIVQKGGIDLILMSIGLKGEIGLNKPGEDFDSYTKVVNGFDEAKLPKRGITIGIRHMFEAKNVILYAGHKDQASIISKVYRSRPTEQLPATVLKLLTGGMVVLDKDSACQVKDLL